MATPTPQIAIVGSGPAGLMAATQIILANSRAKIHLYERRSGLGRKLLIAGSSGLNISHHLPEADFSDHYSGWNPQVWNALFQQFGVQNWIDFIQKNLGLETFLGTSDRYFVREMKASNLLKHWVNFLTDRGVIFHTEYDLIDFENSEKGGVKLIFKNANTSVTEEFAAAALFLGGGSWEEQEPAWISVFRHRGIKITPLEPSNVGYEVKWNADFLKESEGKPLKKIVLETSRGKKGGELVITQYGLEGTPIYFCGTPGPAFLDLKPDLTAAQILSKLSAVKENLSPMRRVKHYLALSPAAESLLFHYAGKNTLENLVEQVKRFPIQLEKPRPLSESISSSGGVALDELNENFQLKKFPHLYCGGEMLDWDAPTGGFLIQACVSQGAVIGKKIGSFY